MQFTFAMFHFPRLTSEDHGYCWRKITLFVFHFFEAVVAAFACMWFALEASSGPRNESGEITTANPTVDPGNVTPTPASAQDPTASATEEAISLNIDEDRIFVYMKVIATLFGFFALFSLIGLYCIIRGLKNLLRSRADVGFVLNFVAVVVYLLAIFDGDDITFVAYFMGGFILYRGLGSYFELHHAYFNSPQNSIVAKPINAAVRMSTISGSGGDV